MIKKITKKLLFTLLFLVLNTSMFVSNVFAWSNGGYSDDPSNPDYGTHDWIAQHALDWMLSGEKEYIENNLAIYLYGTELPDNGQVSDGIGDTIKHHIYYSSDETLQDDSSADRALEEYNLALSYLNSNDFVNAAKHAGIMTHYIADVAVFGHVMGSSTNWGSEQHHSDYESYVNTRTNSYDDDFNTYLSYDSSLDTMTAYDAAVNLAYDTTFDVDGDLTCVWMDQNYDWNNPAFKNRCGESLNLAVNYLTDVLHSLYIDSDLNNSNGHNSNPGNSNEHIVINEVESNPLGNDNYGNVEEWVELYNPTTSSTDISNWKLSTTHGVTVTITIPQGTIIPANGYYVYSRGSQWLDNDDESVVLNNSGSTEVDRTPVKSDNDNNSWSWQRYPNGLDTESASDWTFRSSTEEASNGGEPTPDTAAPTISNVEVNPGSGSVGSVFTISVDVSDPSGVNSVVTYIQRPDETNIATVTLTDPESDGTYTGTWDSTGSSSGTYLVDIVATDGLTNSGEEDNTVTFIVTKIASTILCSVSQDSLTLGESLNVSGSISPELSGKTVTLKYTKPDSSTLTRTCTTNPGDYSDIYTPDVEGSWSVTASWDGDSTHDGSSSSSKSFTVKKKGCIIATATYGSELSPQVQFLRGFRDNTVYSTYAGSSFMTIFNEFYYSFSPSIASVIVGNSALRNIMKAIVYPLIGILHISSAAFSVLSFFPEVGVVIAGLVASSLIGIVYFLPLALIIRLVKKFKVSAKIIRLTGFLWVSSVMAIFIAEVTKSPLIMMASTCAFVLTTISISTLSSLRIVSKRLVH